MFGWPACPGPVFARLALVRIEGSKTEYQTISGETGGVWKPETERIERVIVKNARGHAFYEYGEPMLIEPEHVLTLPLASMTAAERKEFDTAGRAGELASWPEVGSRMMTRVFTGQDMRDGWVIVQDCPFGRSARPLSLVVRARWVRQLKYVPGLGQA